MTCPSCPFGAPSSHGENGLSNLGSTLAASEGERTVSHILAGRRSQFRHFNIAHKSARSHLSQLETIQQSRPFAKRVESQGHSNPYFDTSTNMFLSVHTTLLCFPSLVKESVIKAQSASHTLSVLSVLAKHHIHGMWLTKAVFPNLRGHDLRRRAKKGKMKHHLNG